MSALESFGWLAPPMVASEPEQLTLRLFEGEPWDGRSPRGLTRGHLGVIFNPRGEKEHERIRADLNQLWLGLPKEHPEKRAHWAPSVGAPLLIPLPAERP